MGRKRVLAVDLDGTIFKKVPWQGIHHFGKPEKKVKDCLKFLRAHGFEVLIHSTRLNGALSDSPLPFLKMNVEAVLAVHRIPYDNIFTGQGKPLAEFFVDDRAVFYAGNWEETMREILGRKPKDP